ncbi:unnamed protein product [Clonostachys rosea f. rosea IK726]|uniref:Uncharacterized protein n=1 Tax=Clonostachys rosea f. rosea IK726 TaxID=1349383 RepID=A0ACA9UQL1_BIOOC|nr:unnamed protein product [Clonostachys rosea f. rosea IK726]
MGGGAQVFGRFYQDTLHDYREGLLILSLCESAQKVFLNQPTRLVLHGFYILGTLMELWVFGRSGVYCSQILAYSKEFQKFVGILLYCQNIPETRLLLDSEPFGISEEIIGSGAAYYLVQVPTSNQWEYIVKFKWFLAQRNRPERDSLKLIKKRNL